MKCSFKKIFCCICVASTLALLILYTQTIVFKYQHLLPKKALQRFGIKRMKSTSISALNANIPLNLSFSTNYSKHQECVHPVLDIDDPVMMRMYKKLPRIRCGGEEDWVTVNNGTVVFNQKAVGRHKNFSCDYYPLIREGDDKVSWSKTIKNIENGFRIPTDFFRIVCKGGNGTSYDKIQSGIAYNETLASRKENPMKNGFEGLSIAILGFDSLSRMSWLRRLPKTREYFHKTLGAIELESHNIVGDGTTAVMFPMLTGKFEWELPECRRNKKNTRPLDSFPFIWHDLKKYGYLTSWANAEPKTAPFNYRMLGFKEQPTDFYARPYFLATKPTLKRFTKHCIGSKPLGNVWLDWFRDIFLMYKEKRKFLLHFMTDLSHDDNNLITTLDDDIVELVKFLKEGKYLENTLFILMGDHGARYGAHRSTNSGKSEERLPYFSFLFPPWFEKKYPEAMKNLRTNTKRLTTPFDIHETFRDFIAFGGSGKGDVKNRGISLFKEIPLERSCKHADIAPHWCACLAWKTVNTSDQNVKGALQATLNVINGYTSDYRDDCALLAVGNVSMAAKLETRPEVLKFSSTDNEGGIYKINMGGRNRVEKTLYQLTFFTTPGNGNFEVTVTHDLINKVYLVDEKEISRINKYGEDPACILHKNRQIRQYCYCKSNLNADVSSAGHSRSSRSAETTTISVSSTTGKRVTP